MGEKPSAAEDEAAERRAGTMSQVQNMKRESAGEETGSDEAARSANLNLSKSNINRLGEGEAPPESAEAGTVKSGKSNSSD